MHSASHFFRECIELIDVGIAGRRRGSVGGDRRPAIRCSYAPFLFTFFPGPAALTLEHAFPTLSSVARPVHITVPTSATWLHT